MSVSRKIRSLRINMTLPLGKKWHSCNADCRAGLAILAREHCKRIWRREKSLLLPVGAEHTIVEWKRWIIWAWNQILWHLNIEMVSLIFWYVESNLCRIEMNNGTACGIRFGNVQIVSFVFSFLRTCPMGVYSINFMRVSMLVLLPVAIWGVCHFMWFVFCLALWLWMCRSWWCVGM